MTGGGGDVHVSGDAMVAACLVAAATEEVMADGGSEAACVLMATDRRAHSNPGLPWRGPPNQGQRPSVTFVAGVPHLPREGRVGVVVRVVCHVLACCFLRKGPPYMFGEARGPHLGH